MFRYQRILVPLDGSELAERALVPAARMAEAMSARLILMRVVPPLLRNIGSELYREEAIELSEEQARSYLDSLQRRLSGSPVSVQTKTIYGPVAESIIDYARQNYVDLIIMSSHGRSGLSRWVYGSIALKVLHRTPCAIIIVRAQAKKDTSTFARILVPLDGSSLAEQALPPALGIAEALNAASDVATELILLHVETPIHLALDAPEMAHALEEIDATKQLEAESYLQSKSDSLSSKGKVPATTDIATGLVAESIIDYAAEHEVDLIAMCSHGRSGIGLWLYGSVTEKVLRGANCATLVIRGQDENRGT